jgi:hypothetical protein
MMARVHGRKKTHTVPALHRTVRIRGRVQYADNTDLTICPCQFPPNIPRLAPHRSALHHDRTDSIHYLHFPLLIPSQYPYLGQTLFNEDHLSSLDISLTRLVRASGRMRVRGKVLS